ncbi:hypothetical protein ACIRPK_04910 [Kitasatospora sp. NPDC101801]|uniref:hypothetical protein n=1 Tax=Kitasatospora sp. NPDC101801 TaxID=3364103 RepID=UPI003822D12A
MRTWLSRTALAWGVVMPAAVVAVTGCGAAGQLHDAGQARPVAVRPSAQLLWAAAGTAPTAAPEASESVPPPTALPGPAVPGDEISAVDPRQVLEQDPALRDEERKALTGCQGCTVRSAHYRDLNGDGRAELITAVLTGAEAGYLHVYTLRDGRLYAALAQRVVAGFTAETAGQDLIVHEPNSAQDGTVTTYRWTDVRLAPVDRRITGPAADATLCEPVGVLPSAAPTSRPKGITPEPKVSVFPFPTSVKGTGPVPVKPTS